MHSPENSDKDRRGGEPPASPPASSPPPAAVRRRRRKKKGRKQGGMFIDIVDQAFVHQMMISVWRESEAVLDASSSLEDGLRRLREVGDFGDRGRFAPIWQKNWEEALGEIREADSPPERLEAVRGAVVKSIDEENEARFEAGLPPVIDGQEGQDFIDYTLDRIIEDASGEIEDDLEDEPDEI